MSVRILVVERGPLASWLHRSLRASGCETVGLISEEEPDPAYAEECSFDMVVPRLDRTEDLISAAMDSSSDAIHPGIGSLAESEELSGACRGAGIGFLGPAPEQIAALSDRWTTREIAIAAGVPVTPGSAPIYNLPELREPRQRLGLPLWIKDAWGLSAELAHTDRQLATSVTERIHAGQKVWVEQHIDGARHVVVHFVATGEEAVPLGVCERAVRHHGKLTVDRFPANIEPGVAASVQDAAVRFAEAVQYRGLGSVGFLVDDSGGAYCLGLRPRLSIGALLVDEVQGLRSPELQLRMALEDPLGWDRDDLQPKGHALGVRVRALGSGLVESIEVPAGARFETHLGPGMKASGLLGVLVATGPTAQATVVRALAALRGLRIVGVELDLEPLVQALGDPRLWSGSPIPTE
jgi:biotin carboxylase